MKWFWTWLLLAGLSALGADFVTLAWNANGETNLVGYRVHAGTNSRAYHLCIPTALVTTQRVELPVRARWYFAVTATNAAGLESEFSREVEWYYTPPGPPVMQGEPWVRLTPVIERSADLTNWTSVAGTPTWFPATNRQEFFTTRRLKIERVDRVE